MCRRILKAALNDGFAAAEEDRRLLEFVKEGENSAFLALLQHLVKPEQDTKNGLSCAVRVF